jgi:glycosyltransferase involved in cell wall biosynthesis
MSDHRPIRVLRLTPHFYWPQLEAEGWPVKFDAIGGMQTQIYRQSIALADFNVKQTIVTLRIGKADSGWAAADDVWVEGVRVPVLPIRSRIRGMKDLLLSWSLGVLENVFRSRERYDVIHTHCNGVFWPLMIGCVVQRFLRVPMVLTIHCSIHATYHPMNLLDECLQPFSRFVERAVIRRSAKTITLTSRSRQYYVNLKIAPPERYIAISDGIDVDRFRALGADHYKAAFACRFNIPQGKKIVLYLGRVAREKGWQHMLGIADRLKDANLHFLVCGDGNERDLMEREISARNHSSRFTITGFVPLDLVPAALACSSVMVLPSQHEEFGGAMLEAMAMEVPVVAFDVGGVHEVLDGGKAGRLIRPGDIGGLAQATLELATNQVSARELAARALDRVRSEYSLHSCCQRLRQLYSDVCVMGVSK